MSFRDPCFEQDLLDAEQDTDLATWHARVAAGGIAQAAAQARGGFAVGLRTADGRTLLAVDRFAIKTLCYRIVDGELRFARDAQALRDDAAPIDPQALYDYLYFHAIPSPRTAYRGIHRLPAGHCAVFERGQLRIEPYWRPRFAPAQGMSFQDKRAEFLLLLREAVRQQLDGTQPACFLSGGTDSSTVAGMICEVAGRPAATYSIGFEAAGYDEMAFARIAAKHFGTEHHEYYVTPDDLVQGIAKVAASYDQPFGNSSALPAYYCALKARGDGVSRLLAGDGGDELFGGNSRYAMLRVFGWYQQVPGFLRRGLMEPFFGLPAVARTPIIKKGSGYIRQATTPMPDRLQNHNLLVRLGAENVLPRAWLAQVDQAAPLRQQREVWAACDAADDLDRNLAYDWRYTLAESDLPKVRGTSQLAGVTVRYPMLDHALVDFSMRLAPADKLRGLKLRWFFKEALRGFLPDEIITKKKQGFGLPFGVWALRHQALNKLAADSVRGAAARGLVRPDFADQLLGTLLPQHPGYYGEMVWLLMMLEQWLRAHHPAWRVG